MSLDLTNFADANLDEAYVSYLIEQESLDACLHFSRLWEYFRNPISPAVGLPAEALNANSRPYFQAQEAGLPARITGVNRSPAGRQQLTDVQRKEVVIENDIAWRVQTMVDFLFGKPISIRSLARQQNTAKAVEAVIQALLEANGGQQFFHELALLGSVYGFVDVVLRTPPDWPPYQSHPASAIPPPPAGGAADSNPPGAPSPATSAQPGGLELARALRLAGRLSLETVEARASCPCWTRTISGPSGTGSSATASRRTAWGV